MKSTEKILEAIPHEEEAVPTSLWVCQPRNYAHYHPDEIGLHQDSRTTGSG